MSARQVLSRQVLSSAAPSREGRLQRKGRDSVTIRDDRPETRRRWPGVPAAFHRGARGVAGTVLVLLLLAAPVGAQEPSTSPSLDRLEAPRERADRPASIQEILERASRWVIALRVERTKDIPRPRRGAGIPESMFPKEMQSYYERPEGWVTGVVVNEVGLVATSVYNVSGEIKSIEARVPTGETFPAEFVARSISDDIALLQLDLGESSVSLETPEWADATRLRAGQIVLAVGRSPDPSSITVTRGILSAVTRNGGRAVQTDAEINYGNVGGPLLDLDGRVVAISGFVGHDRPQWGVNSGVGFGTTGTTLLAMLPDLEKGGEYVAFRFPFLGVRGTMKFVGGKGAKIEEAVADGPAAKAGVRKDDLIVEFAGAPVENFEQLRRRIFEREVGEIVKLKVLRGKEIVECEVTLGEIQP